jgi:hypothetical protein
MPQPENIAFGTLEMSLRQLLRHMIDTKVNHVVLVIPGSEMRVAITVAGPADIESITEFVGTLLK